MSRFTPSPSSLSTPTQEQEEMRELDEFLAQHDTVQGAAVDWHTRKELGLSPAEQQAFEQWLAASPENKAAFTSLDQDITLLRALPGQDVPAVETRSGQYRAKPGRFSWAIARSGLVFACALCLVVGMTWLVLVPQGEPVQHYVAEHEPLQHLTLADGSALSLDAQTQVQVNLSSDRREVRLQQGHVMFAVTPDPQSPFEVLAGAARVTVVGTRFSVRYRSTGWDAQAVTIAVEEGHVRVATAGSQQSDSVIDVLAGQELRVLADGAVEPVTQVAASSIAPWRKGLLRFDNTPLGLALEELERYGDTGLVIRDPVVAAMPIGGSFQIAQPQAFAAMLMQILPVKLIKNDTGSIEIVQDLARL